MTQTDLRGSFRRVQTGGGFLARPRKARYVYLLAFFVPMLVIELLWAIHEVMPFGDQMILAHDQWHQYYPFYLDLRERLVEGNSLLHSWRTGMGINYLSMFAYYLASPLNWVAALLPVRFAMYWYNFAVLLRFGLAGLCFAFFLRKTLDRTELAVSVFAVAYALCAFFMGYYWNAIWLDTVALTPLVVTGTVALLKEGKWTLYTFSLFLAVWCSYYIGFFVCIFVLLIFIGWHVVNWDDIGGFGIRLLKFALFTAVALGMTAMLTVPAFLGLQATSNAENKFPKANALNVNVGTEDSINTAAERLTAGELSGLNEFFGREPVRFDAERKVSYVWGGPDDVLLNLKLGEFKAAAKSFLMPLRGFRKVLSNTADGVVPTTMEGLPNIACGFITLILAILYLFCRRIPLRERIFAVLLLFFFGCSFLFRTLDYIWHGFHFPNMLPFRFSFLWSFTVIYMGCRAYTELDTVRWWRVALAGVPCALILWQILDVHREPIVLIPTLAAAVVSFILLLLFSTRTVKKTLLVWALCIGILGESCLTAVQGVEATGTTGRQFYPWKNAQIQPLITEMEEREKGTGDLWRAEIALKYTLNEGTLFGYNGISTFSSAANSRVSKFLQSIGLAASVGGNRYVYQEADPFTNLLLNLKYIIDRGGRHNDRTYFEQVYENEGVRLLKNKAYVPLGFAVSDNALNFVPDVYSQPYDQLNRLFREMTGEEGQLYAPFNAESVEALGSAKISSKTTTTFSAVCENADENNCIEVTFRMPKDGYLCIYSKSSKCKDLVVYVNGNRQYTYSDGYGYNRSFGSLVEGDRVSLRYLAKNGSTPCSATFGAAIFQTELFDSARAKLMNRRMITTLVSDTRIEGAISMQEPGLVYTSIPYDDGWTLTVDGEPTGITPVGEAMIAFHLEPGMHTVELRFEPPGLSAGLTVSMVCGAAFLILLILALLMRFRTPPIVKVKLHLEDPEAKAQPEVYEPEAAGEYGQDEAAFDWAVPDGVPEGGFVPQGGEPGAAPEQQPDEQSAGALPPEADPIWAAPVDSGVMDGETAVFRPQNGLEPEAPPIESYPEDDINLIFPPKEPENPE